MSATTKIVKHFREQQWGDNYSFRYVKGKDDWEIFCEVKPPNTDFPTDAATTHIFADNRLCITADRRP